MKKFTFDKKENICINLYIFYIHLICTYSNNLKNEKKLFIFLKILDTCYTIININVNKYIYLKHIFIILISITIKFHSHLKITNMLNEYLGI